jgi:hypothetical protein
MPAAGLAVADTSTRVTSEDEGHVGGHVRSAPLLHADAGYYPALIVCAYLVSQPRAKPG